jgi:DNA polymerase III alpha subunit
LKYAKSMQEIELPNHLSIHAGGILISQKPIHYFSATNLPPKGFPTTQFDMHTAEDVGLYKFDILGQRGLAKIKEALTIIKQNQPDAPAIDINDVKKFIKDPQINALISEAQCIGCFYVESPAMRMLLKKLRVDNYLGLVAASSIIRPGVAKSGMMREYILRHQSKERQKEALPALLELMPETYGIMVYQEDVIKVAHYFAGLTLSEADVLRRGMSGKFRNRDEFQKVRDKFIENCREKGYSDKTVMDVWNQIESFAGYAFAKGHSASYAVESYQSLFLKTYYPLEYMVAVLNNGGGFYHPELYVHEARMLGATVEAPCVNQSWVETVIKGKTIYLGFAFLTGIEEKTCNAIAQERMYNGTFRSLDDFLDRVAISVEQVSLLLRINAFRFTGIDKRTLLWQAHFKLNHTPNKVTQNQLFKPERKQFSLPAFSISPTEEAYDQIELLGFPLCSPFSLLENPVSTSEVLVDELGKYINQVVTISGYYVAAKNTRTSKGERMNFGTFLDREGHFIDTVHFPLVAAQYPFRGRGVYSITGKVVDEFGFLSIEVIKMEKLAYVPDPRYADN